MSLAQKQSAQHRLDELKRGYRPEEIAAAEARYHQTQATLEKFERGNRPEDIAAANAALAMDEARFRDARCWLRRQQPWKCSTCAPAT